MFDLHRHSEFSTFDGFGRAIDLARLAQQKGHTALSNTDHGNTNGLVKIYKACKEVGIKSILGVEGYFLPKYVEKHRGYHLVLIAKDLEGYGNLNRLQFEGDKIKYYNPIWTFELLEKYSKGLICTTACVGGYLGQAIKQKQPQNALRYLKRLQNIFEDDLYIEVQPYVVNEIGLQENVNKESMNFANQLGIKCILTSDSHFGDKSHLPTYLKMHEIAGHNLEHIRETYSERYMPTQQEIVDRFFRMHDEDCDIVYESKRMLKALDEIDSKCEDGYLNQLELKLPRVKQDEFKNSYDKLRTDVRKGLQRLGKWNTEYIERCKEELAIIKMHSFQDYFLMVADYVQWAKNQGIAVGPGRGSVCNSLVAYALGITEVDSLYFGLFFRRFLREDKKGMPDIDLDFQTSRRGEIIDYICNKYKGKAARICSYGLYKVDNLVNDLSKVCGLSDKLIIAEMKQLIAQNVPSFSNDRIDDIDYDKIVTDIKSNKRLMELNKQYYNIIDHFCLMFCKVRYIGTHAAGVAIVGGNLLDYVAIREDSKSHELYTNYDLDDLHQINVIKFDILGLKTMESIAELRNVTGKQVDLYKAINDKELITDFRLGKTEGIFQLETHTPKKILVNVQTDSFDDIVATNAMNRPGPLRMGMPQQYAENKLNSSTIPDTLYSQYTEKTYGTILYQEQVQRICLDIGGLTLGEIDKFIKATLKVFDIKEIINDPSLGDYAKQFVKNAVKRGMSKKEAIDLLLCFFAYSFNQGHATGYSLISIEEMFYKHYHPIEYWFVKLKYAKDVLEYEKFCFKAVCDGVVLFLPHVNLSHPKSALRTVEGDMCIQQGLSEIKNVGEKASDFIYQERRSNGVFTNFDDFYDRCKNRLVTTRVVSALEESGALVFDRKIYNNRVTKYNSAMYSRGMT